MVKKRNGKSEKFEGAKIYSAVFNASKDSVLGESEELAESISFNIYQQFKELDTLSVEQIQDLVEDELMKSDRRDVAKVYILYRNQKDQERKIKKVGKKQLLTDEFISKYKHIEPPMTELGKFVYYRTYSRWLLEYKRREYWWETVRRAVEYTSTLMPTSREEAEEFYDDVFNLRQLPSARTLWIGGTSVTDVSAMANLNCSFLIIDKLSNLYDLFYLLLIGSGVGFRVLKEDVDKIQPIRSNIELIHEQYIKVPKNKRNEHTSVVFDSTDTVRIIIGDSRQGWVDALKYYIEIRSSKFYYNITRIIMNYDNIRPSGEPLKSFGGRASGHESILHMFIKLHNVLQTDVGMIKLRPIHILDMANIIAENVIVGSIRRTAEICIVSQSDSECIEAKSNLYVQINGKWEINKTIEHRQLSNNTIAYESKPTREFWKWHLNKMRYSGEPGILNLEAARKRNPNAQGVNPCGEILLDNKQNCNLTTINIMAFVENGKLNMKALEKTARLNARVGYRMTNLDLELPDWEITLKRDRLMGVSITGYIDMVNATGINKEEEIVILSTMKKWIREAADNYADSLGYNRSLLVTTQKPSGNTSTMLGVSPGIHYPHSEYFIRRVRIARNDPLAQVMIDSGFSVKPETGEEMDTCRTIVVEFPTKSPKGKTKFDVSALEQLENYKMWMDYYTEHNNSVTISVRDDEWELVEEWVFEHWDEVVAISFLSLNDSFYKLMPYEAIDKEIYEKMYREMPKFSSTLLTKYEREEYERDLEVDAECNSGACPIR